MIEVKSLTKFYGKKQALDNVSFEIPLKSSFAVIGENGAGKSTFINILSGFVHKTSGEVIFRKKSKLGVMPQDSALEGSMTCKSFLVLISGLEGRTRKQAQKEAMSLLEKVKLENEANTKIRKLSHGMRKRLQIAQALIGDPEILVFDEPVSGLDPRIARTIKDLIGSLSKEKTMIYCTHNLNEVEELCDIVLILKNGRVVKTFQMEKLSKGNKVVVVYNKRPTDLMEQLKKKKYIRNLLYKNKTLELTFENRSREKEVVSLLTGSDFVSLKRGVSLESEFLESTK
ncbi:MAG: ABC transporter ATP-binding protein [DPANN group archaeon]|nr:ABC transporter ATP-binding protein [DPANN group archaeon]